MKPAPFDYFAPTTVDEVRDLLDQYGDDAKILAGGQSLVPVIAGVLSQPSVVIDINRLRELDYIRDDAHGLQSSR
jgi:carbon-monoxide dehydrogenase medium subunit